MADPPFPDAEEDLPEPPRLRALRRMVSLLTATLIIGFLVVVAALVIRLTRHDPPAFDPATLRAERLVLPKDETPLAAGAARGALILVTRDAGGAERVRFFDAATGAETASIPIERR